MPKNIKEKWVIKDGNYFSYMTKKEKWEDEFDKEFCDKRHSCFKYPADTETIKQFIKSLLAKKDKEFKDMLEEIEAQLKDDFTDKEATILEIKELKQRLTKQ